MAKRIIKLDEYNKKILAIVHKEADLSNQELAERVGLSPSACFQRKKALREAGYFFNFHCEMDLDRICEHVLAYVEFYLHSNTMPYKSAFESAIQAIPEFMDCLRISGDMDYISFTCFPNLTALKDACDTLSANDSLGIKRIEIRPILERTKWYLGYPLEKLKWLEDQPTGIATRILLHSKNNNNDTITMPINTATNPATGYIAIDQGTTSSRAILFDVHFAIIHIAQQPFDQHYPKNGWVEHDPEAIWQTVQAVTQEALSAAHSKGLQVKHIGIVNQRETTLVWHRETGKCVYPAIVWQDRRTRDICKGLKPHEQMVQSKTGLRLDPYFSATKVSWILDNVPGARAQAEQGELLFGTVDSFLIWRLTEGRVHATDVTNASRTCLFNINTTNWDPALLSLFNVPASMLPTVKDCADDFGTTTHFDAPLHISGVAGDQQAALIGQGCVRPGNVKATYGTGCFALVNTGTQCDINQHNLLTTLAYRIKGQTHYAVEGSIFIAGAAVQWLRDGIQLITHAADSEQIASEVDDEHGLVVVPAFTGLGAPYWEPSARGAIFGISRATTAAHIVRATLESVCYQTNDLLEAMSSGDIRPSVLKVDGGMVANSWFCQHLANTLNTQVVRPVVMETTALGAALLAAIQAGQLSGLDAIQNANPTECTFNPEGNDEQRQQRLAQWKQAVSATLLMAQHA